MSEFFWLYCGFMQDHYVFMVSQFMYIPWNYARKQAAIRASVLSGDSSTPSINIGAAEAFESEITEYIKEQV
jgi:DNA polymerase epsilon subunit 1